jgi:hypothetical protein
VIHQQQPGSETKSKVQLNVSRAGPINYRNGRQEKSSEGELAAATKKIKRQRTCSRRRIRKSVEHCGTLERDGDPKAKVNLASECATKDSRTADWFFSNLMRANNHPALKET